MGIRISIPALEAAQAVQFTVRRVAVFSPVG
jgi:hypothetical protein